MKMVNTFYQVFRKNKKVEELKKPLLITTDFKRILQFFLNFLCPHLNKQAILNYFYKATIMQLIKCTTLGKKPFLNFIV